MGKRKTILLFVLLVIVAVGGGLIWSRSGEPEYEGKKLNAWLDDWGGTRSGRVFTRAGDGNPVEVHKKVIEALREIGPRAVPYIVRRFKEDKSPWRKKYRSIYEGGPPLVQRVLPRPRERFGSTRVNDAVLFTGISASPEFFNFFKDDDAQVRALAAGFSIRLYQDASASERVIPELTGLLKDNDFIVREAAVEALGSFGTKAAPAVSSLIPLLNVPKEKSDASGRIIDVRLETAKTLGNIGPEAKSAVPVLMPLLKAPTPYTRTIAAEAIWKISGDATNTVPVLIKALGEIDQAWMWKVIEGLEQMGQEAKPAVPALLEILRRKKIHADDIEGDRIIRNMITNALIKINPGGER